MISVSVIQFYQKWISPILPRSCRFEPTCSEYARQCFLKFSWSKACFLSLKRIMRCHPYCEGGYDPVPQKGESRETTRLL